MYRTYWKKNKEVVSSETLNDYYTKTQADAEFLSSNQGAENSGKILGIDSTGTVTPVINEAKPSIQALQDVGGSSEVTLLDNTIFTTNNTIQNLTVTEPSNPTVSFGSILQFTSGSVATSVIPSNIIYRGDSTANGVFTPIANKRYSVYFTYNGVNICGTVQGV